MSTRHRDDDWGGDVCSMCGNWFEPSRTTAASPLCVQCTLCVLTLERFGPMQDLLRERFTRPERARI